MAGDALVTAPDRLRTALAEFVGLAQAELPHVIIDARDDPRLVVGCLLGWVGFQQMRESGPASGLAQDWEYLARCHAVALGRIAKARTDLARLSAAGDDVDLYHALFTRPAVAPSRRTLIPFQKRGA